MGRARPERSPLLSLFTSSLLPSFPPAPLALSCLVHFSSPHLLLLSPLTPLLLCLANIPSPPSPLSTLLLPLYLPPPPSSPSSPSLSPVHLPPPPPHSPAAPGLPDHCYGSARYQIPGRLLAGRIRAQINRTLSGLAFIPDILGGNTIPRVLSSIPLPPLPPAPPDPASEVTWGWRGRGEEREGQGAGGRGTAEGMSSCFLDFSFVCLEDWLAHSTRRCVAAGPVLRRRSCV